MQLRPPPRPTQPPSRLWADHPKKYLSQLEDLLRANHFYPRVQAAARRILVSKAGFNDVALTVEDGGLTPEFLVRFSDSTYWRKMTYEWNEPKDVAEWLKDVFNREAAL